MPSLHQAWHVIRTAGDAHGAAGHQNVARIAWEPIRAEPSRAPTAFRKPQRRRERMSSSALSTRLGELVDARLLALHADDSPSHSSARTSSTHSVR